MKKLLKIAVFLVLAVGVLAGLGSMLGENSSRHKAGPVFGAVSRAADPAPGPRQESEAASAANPKSACAIGQAVSGDIVAVTGEFEPRTSPSGTGKRIKNEKASSILGSTRYHVIDSSTSVRRLCADGDWSEVQIVSPQWLAFVKGWVPNKVLRGIERTAGGTRIYVKDDFLWDDGTARYAKQIVAVVNAIAQEHSGCSDIDTASVSLSPSRSKPKDPVFFVTCNPSSGAPFNVWFRPTDVGKSFTASRPISQGDAVLACEQAAKAAARHPSSVDFSRFLDVAYVARQDGRVSLESSFTAKNGFNLELKYRIRCLFDGSKLVESTIAEAG